MACGVLENIEIKGIACAVPETKVNSEAFYDKFGAENVDKFVKMTGVKERCVASKEQTSSDLCYVAAEKVIAKLGWEKDSIDAVVFVSQSPDYRLPATACVLHGRLGLKQNCVAFDVNLGCSGYVYGLFIIGSLMQGQNINRVLLLAGGTLSKLVCDEDRSTAMLFGDAGSATAIEKSQNSQIKYLLKTNGEGYKSIIVPAGAYRNADGSSEIKSSEDGIARSDFDLAMNGTDVFNFTISDVPAAISEFNTYFNLSIENFDYCVLHQANLFMLKHIAKKVKITPEQFPITIDRFGNTSVTSIPLTIADLCNSLNDKTNVSLLLCGFGVGLSWGVVSLNIKPDACLPIIYTNEFFEDGVI